jgi:hypothetical protein
MKAEELLHVMREQEHRPGKDEGKNQPPLEIGQHALMALACMVLSCMAGMSHLLLGLFLFDFCHRLLICGLMMRVG